MRKLAMTLLAPLALTGQVVPFTLHGPVVVVSVRLNGQGPFRMVVDTGATSCSILPGIAAKLRLKPEYRVLDVTPKDQRWIPGARSVDVSIGAQTATNVEFLFRKTPGFDEAGLDVDGVLGQSLLTRFDYLLDYRTRQLVLGPETPGKSGGRIPFDRIAGRMSLRATNPSDGTIRLILDSGASNVYLWRAHGLDEFRMSASLVTLNGRRSVDLFQMPVLVVGDQVLQKLDAVVAPPPDRERDEDGLLPAVLFRSVYVSNSESYVRLRR